MTKLQSNSYTLIAVINLSENIIHNNARRQESPKCNRRYRLNATAERYINTKDTA